LFRHVDLTELRHTSSDLDIRWAVLAVILLMLQIPLMALRWLDIVRVLQTGGKRLTYLWMIVAAAIGQFFGQILPLVAGDGVRIWLLARHENDWRDAAMSVVIDRCIGVGLLLAFAFAILFLPSSLGLFDGHRGEILVVIGAILFVAASGLVLGAAFAHRRRGGWIASFFTGAARAVFGPYCITILGAGCLIHLLTIAAVWSLGRAQGLILSPADAAILFAVMMGIALVPLSVGGWGLREFAMLSLFGNYGLTPERALLFSTYFGLACVIASLPGAVAWFGFLVPRSEPSSERGE
jgi:glycosyltransferase 2 family protein